MRAVALAPALPHSVLTCRLLAAASSSASSRFTCKDESGRLLAASAAAGRTRSVFVKDCQLENF